MQGSRGRKLALCAARPKRRRICSWRGGRAIAAFEPLLPLVNDELRQIARGTWRERDGHTLQPTALVNEAYLRLVERSGSMAERAHFFAMAARMMRRILVDTRAPRG